MQTVAQLWSRFVKRRRVRRAASGLDRLTAAYYDLKTELVELLTEVTDDPHPPELRLAHANAGCIKLYDAVVLAELVGSLRPRRLLEVGSFVGFSTRWLLEAGRRWGTEVVSVDPDVRHRVFDRPGDLLRRFNARDLGTRLTQKRGFFSDPPGECCYHDYEHYAPVVPRPQAEALLRGVPVLTGDNLDAGTFDFIFLDGDHTEEAVLRNFADALKVLRPGGCVVFHDALSWPEVTRAVGEIGERHAARGTVEIFGRSFRRFNPQELCDGIGVFRQR